jgi:hypothetical protein
MARGLVGIIGRLSWNYRAKTLHQQHEALRHALFVGDQNSAVAIASGAGRGQLLRAWFKGAV